MKYPKCSNIVLDDNFCTACGTKLREKCKCWVLKKDSYSCGEDSCPGYNLLIKLGLNKVKGEKTSSDKINDFQKQKVWAPFPERHPWLPAIISIIALIAAYTKG